MTLWVVAPQACAAVDGALWDAIARTKGLPVYRLAPARTAFQRALPYYAACLQLTPEATEILFSVRAAGYSVAKWSILQRVGLACRLSALRALDIGWGAIALDAHTCLTPGDVEFVSRHAAGIAWLEDPFPASAERHWRALDMQVNAETPAIVAGETLESEDALLTLSKRRSVGAIRIEVERVGFTRSVRILEALGSIGKTCLLHGRLLAVAAHLARMFPDVVRGVECNLAFAGERLATLPREAGSDPRDVVAACLLRAGLGSEPGDECELVDRVRLL